MLGIRELGEYWNMMVEGGDGSRKVSGPGQDRTMGELGGVGAERTGVRVGLTGAITYSEKSRFFIGSMVSYSYININGSDE